MTAVRGDPDARAAAIASILAEKAPRPQS